MSQKTFRYVFLVAIGIILITFAISNSYRPVSTGELANSQTGTPDPTLLPTPTLLVPPLPAYIENIFPEPGTQITVRRYESRSPLPEDFWQGYRIYSMPSTICMGQDLKWLAIPGDTEDDLLTVGARQQLIVNGEDYQYPEERQLRETIYVSYGGDENTIAYVPAPSVRCWSPKLGVGIHNITFRFEQTDGNIVDYSWQFEIVGNDVEIEVTPLPSYIPSIQPYPGETYTTAEYHQDSGFLGNLAEPSICFFIGPSRFVERGEIVTKGQFLSWLYITVDDVRLTQYNEIFELGPPLVEFDSQTSEIIRQGPSDLHLCYAAALNPGIHSATIHVDKSEDQQESYTWSFEIIE